ncbi:dihydrolipoamide acetyltransferase family protein [Albimonas sp. CAU 1670]|uniref:dihydrolipoamide acetyltransferase family protein n=1 Tax=Albimonas sp. CAU 1670 TaxID=3032599 RepID=UPI0023D9CE62|nr:dihydrolipoamide acetyltransferase family protein [Albimonas sp. CAU 1670]MDF2234835.1 dihydrolipoamide acetyltransferase family protein [Albimonas sp. CAU 1670]
MGVFRMPSLGSDMEAGTLVEWLVKPGDAVQRGDVVAVVETQKGAIEIECFEAGRVATLIAQLGDELPVGAPLALILAPGEAEPEPEARPDAAAAPRACARAPEAALAPPGSAAASEASPPPGPVAPPGPLPPGVRASPAARVRARDLGIDLRSLAGSGPDGAILLDDLGARPGPAAVGRASPREEMRKAIAAAMSRSKRTIPHFYLARTMDVQPAIDWLARRNADAPPEARVLFGALVVRAAVLAAADVEAVNGRYVDNAFHPSAKVNPAIVVALRGGGLVAPALQDAAGMDLDRTMAVMRDLATRARAGRLRSSEVGQGTITISSLGETGVDAMAGVIFPPQVALLGVGAPQVRPWVVQGAVVPRTVLTLTLSADHRVADGRQGARFLTAIEARIASPETL